MNNPDSADVKNAEIAAALLDLEETYQAHGLSDEQLRQWEQVVFKLLWRICPKGNKRTDLRFAASGTVAFSIDGAEREGELLDVSKDGFGVRVGGQALEAGTTVELIALKLEDRELAFGCSAKIARTSAESVGIELLRDDESARKTLFDGLYYPLYLGYLRKLAQA